MAEYTALAPLFTDIANAIRSKTGETGAITANTFPEKILSLKNISEYFLDSKVGNNTSLIQFDNVSYVPTHWTIICFQTYSNVAASALCYLQSAASIFITFAGNISSNGIYQRLQNGIFTISTSQRQFSNQIEYYLIA